MEVFADSIMVMIIGMVIVFAVLILLMYIIKSIKFLGGSKMNIIENNTMPLPIEPTPTAVINDGATDYELIAAITAALAASLGTSPDKLIVRSLRKVSQNDKTAWRTAAKADSQHKINQWR